MPKKMRGRRAAETLARRKRVGQFIRERRRALKMSQSDIQRRLGYRSVMSVADVELGRAGLPFKRIYQYADVLRIPRDELVRFAIGEIQNLGSASVRPPKMSAQSGSKLTAAEQELIDTFRRLPTADRNRIRSQIRAASTPRGRRTTAGRAKRAGSRR